MTRRPMKGTEYLLGLDLASPTVTALTHEKAVQQILENVKAAQLAAAVRLGTHKKQSKVCFDKTVHATEFVVGQQVMLSLYNPSSFLSPKFAGPYTISDKVSPSVYKITYPNGNSAWFHINQLKAYGSQNNHAHHISLAAAGEHALPSNDIFLPSPTCPDTTPPPEAQLRLSLSPTDSDSDSPSTPPYDYTPAPGPTPSDSEHDSSDPFEIMYIKAPVPDPPSDD
ncbi:hypothetical protein scyTo_0004616 [Scyliorhinus torazame]|uniref:Tf2-1-like SH3-like domain-containing protein n=1 Tax=Scyliorhinus torazame TaxID=75743 RepID=A0A401NUH5_SCYTO|nr:hypothetical protein [Scyliorhinus torazame]